MKRYSILYIIRELQIKTIIRYHYTHIRMPKIQTIDNTRWWQGCEARGTLLHCWQEYKLAQSLWKTVWQFLRKLRFFNHCCSVAHSCPTLCDPMDCSTPDHPVPHHLPTFAQVHVHCISDAIQPSHPLMPSSLSAVNLSQHQGLFQ